MKKTFLLLKTISFWLSNAAIEWTFLLFVSPSFLPVMWRLLEWSSFRSPYKMAEEDNLLAQVEKQEELTYGEILLPTIEKVFRELKCDKHTQLIDLGSGRGKIVLYAAHKGMSAKGFELVSGLIETANYAASNQFPNAEFIQKNFLEADLSEGTIFWLSGTCLSETTRHQLSQKLQELPHNPLIISVSCPLPNISIQKTIKAQTSWGSDILYLQQVD